MKKILLGISGGIAAYKTPALVRLMVKKGWEVRVCATKNALKLVSSDSLATVSMNPVRLDTFESTGDGVDHIDTARWADIIVVAPATANIIGKFANGIADDYLSTLLCAAHSPVVMAPGMNDRMYENAAVQQNIEVLKSRGVMFCGPEIGELACKTSGVGRMSEPEDIVSFIENNTGDYKPLKDLNILVSAGATREYFDPARFWSNPSSGKMGNEIARYAAVLGGNVTLVHAHMDVKPAPHVKAVSAPNAESMFNEIKKRAGENHVIIMAAAVSDWTFPMAGTTKLKKSNVTGEKITLELVRTKDILASISASRDHNNKLIIGFAAETASGDDLIKLATEKLIRKNCDAIIANDISPDNTAFGSDSTTIYPIWKNDETAPQSFTGKKSDAVKFIWERICEKLA